MKKVVINYSYFKLILNFITSIILITLGVYLLFEVNYKLAEYRTMMKDIFLFLIAISLIISYSKIFYKNLKNLNNKIILSELGIEVNGIFYNWYDISFPKMIVKKEFVGKNNLLHDFDYLSFSSQQKKIEVKIDDYQTNKEKLIAFLNDYKVFSKSNNQSSFGLVMSLDDFFNLSESESKKIEKQTIHLINNQSNEFKNFCRKDVFDKISQLEFLYFILNENQKNWEDFLASEFVSLFNLADNENAFKTLDDLLDQFYFFDNNIEQSRKVIDFLNKQLISSDSENQFYAIKYLENWLPENFMDQFPEVYYNINRLKLSNKWKVRWKAIEFLKDQDENLQHNLIDSLRNKVLNTDLY